MRGVFLSVQSSALRVVRQGVEPSSQQRRAKWRGGVSYNEKSIKPLASNTCARCSFVECVIEKQSTKQGTCTCMLKWITSVHQCVWVGTQLYTGGRLQCVNSVAETSAQAGDCHTVWGAGYNVHYCRLTDDLP